MGSPINKVPAHKRNQKPAYPNAFLTPEGRPVSIRKMAEALRVIRANPSAEYPGWTWYTVPGYFILNEFRRGLHDRINKRGIMKPCNK